MATKIVIKSDKYTPWGGIFYVINLFKHFVAHHVDTYLGPRCHLYGYQYGEALIAMAGNFFSGGYGPGCAVLTDPRTGQDVIVGIENRDGNTPVKFFDERSD